MMPTSLLIVAIALGTCVATLLGGWLALSLKRGRNLVLGFSAGAVIGVAFFDLLPEALSLSGSSVLLAAALGFLVYFLFDRLVAQCDGHVAATFLLGRGSGRKTATHFSWNRSRRGLLGAASLSAHSLLDGFGIGIAFQAGHGAGLVVAAAVVAHDFADGLNTVNVVTSNGGARSQARRWLIADAVAPLLGAGLSLFFSLSPAKLGLLLAGFAGFFLYIGAVDLLPESQRGGGRLGTTLATLLGALFLYAVARMAM
jgi:zinc transporter ZupT